MLTIAVACLALARPQQAPLVTRVNGPLAGNVSRFTWARDGRFILYGAERDSTGIDAVTSVRVADGSETTYDPYAFFFGTAVVTGFDVLPDRRLVGVRYTTTDAMSFPPTGSSPLHVLECSSASQVALIGNPESPRFLDDGRMLYRTVLHAFRGSTYERGWMTRWDGASTPLEVPPPQPDNHVSLILHAPHAGVAVFGWAGSYFSGTNAELFAVPLDGGTPVPLTPPPTGHLRTWVDAVHMRSSDELV